MPNPKPELRPTGPEDHPAIARFLADFPGEKRGVAHWEQRLQLWWELNPACTSNSLQGYGLFVQDQLQGFMGNIPFIMMLNGQEVEVVNPTAWKVLPPARTASMLLWFSMQKAAKKSIMFCMTPSPEALKVQQGLRFKPVPSQNRRTEIKLTYTRPLEVRLKNSTLAKAAAWLPNAMAKSRLSKLAIPEGLRVGLIDNAGTEFDNLWQRTQGLYAFTNLRTAAVLNWLCFGHPHLTKLLFACYQGEVLAGYMIARRVGAPGDYGLECLDLWQDPSIKDVVPALVTSAVQHALAQNWDLVILPHFSAELGQELAALALGTVKETPSIHSFKAAKQLSKEFISGPTYLCGLQGDAGL